MGVDCSCNCTRLAFLVGSNTVDLGTLNRCLVGFEKVGSCSLIDRYYMVVDYCYKMVVDYCYKMVVDYYYKMVVIVDFVVSLDFDCSIDQKQPSKMIILQNKRRMRLTARPPAIEEKPGIIQDMNQLQFSQKR